MQVDYFESEFDCIQVKSPQDKQDDRLSHTWEVSIERDYRDGRTWLVILWSRKQPFSHLNNY